jgi:hypothetical protein
MSVNEIFDELCKNNDFLSYIDHAIHKFIINKNIIDINHIIYIITVAYNNYTITKICSIDFPLLIKTIFLFIVNKHQLINPSEIPFIESKVNSAIKLLMIRPSIKKK